MLVLKTDTMNVSIDESGYITSIYDAVNSREYLKMEKKAPLLQIVVDNEICPPASIEYRPDTKMIVLNYEGSITMEVEALIKNTHITFEVKSIGRYGVTEALWGPYPIAYNDRIGEIIGVAGDENFVIGIQSLNTKTLGGWPSELNNEYDDCHPNQPIYSLSVRGEYYCDCTAAPTSWGSVLQAYSRDMSREYIRKVEGIDGIEVQPVKDEDASLIGSKIALFGCNRGSILETIGNIEVEEGLPHPIIDGQWGKTSQKATSSYMIVDFTEENIQEVLSFARSAGLEYIYHPDPFKNWGHFELREDHFPNGDEGLKNCIDKAQALSIGVGVHTLTNFTTTNDPYVTPVPDSRLLKTGKSKLAFGITENDTEIPIENPEPFRDKTWLSTVVMGTELIKYQDISETEPWVLTGCERGAYGTRADAHEKGENIEKLLDYAYKTLYPNQELQDEYCKHITELFNNTGLKQISFDGLEGCYKTGHGEYGVNRFVKMCSDGWKHEVINDASRLNHYLWHVHTRMNWGEPWGAAMREGQLEVRLINQKFYERNCFPKMLGWFLMRLCSSKFEATTMDDIEWMLSKAAGYNAGFSICSDFKVLKSLGNIEQLLASIKHWEKARMTGAFTQEQRERMKDPKSEWHLKPQGEDQWLLYPVEISSVYSCSSEELQPGQPGGADWAYENKYDPQPLKFRLRVMKSPWCTDGYIENPSFIANGRHITFRTKVSCGQYLVCGEDGVANIYDENWNLLNTVKCSSETPRISKGRQIITLGCDFGGSEKPEVQVRFITMGLAEMVKK